jgi:hypothetical protein
LDEGTRIVCSQEGGIRKPDLETHIESDEYTCVLKFSGHFSKVPKTDLFFPLDKPRLWLEGPIFKL